jgi:hypothetical protein
VVISVGGYESIERAIALAVKFAEEKLSEALRF